jgi:hypothetical protein
VTQPRDLQTHTTRGLQVVAARAPVGGARSVRRAGRSTTSSSTSTTSRGNNTQCGASSVDPTMEVTTLNAAGQGHRDGPLAQALFSLPAHCACDVEGNVHIADSDNHRIRKVGPSSYSPCHRMPAFQFKRRGFKVQDRESLPRVQGGSHQA